jgi:hypothetical protein
MDRQHNANSQRTNKDPQNTTQKTKDWSTPTPIKHRLIHVLRKGKPLLLHQWHPSRYSLLQRSTSREWGKGMIANITYPRSFVTQIFRNGQPSHGGDTKTND